MESNDIKSIIIETYAYTEDVMFAEGLDDAIIGFEPNLWRVVYSRNKVIDITLKNIESEDEDEAIEFAEYNIFGAYVGEKTPLFIEDFNW